MCDARQSHTYHQRTRTRFFNLPTMHRNHPSEFALAPHSTRLLCAPVLT
jgi:hypothetical protein